LGERVRLLAESYSSPKLLKLLELLHLIKIASRMIFRAGRHGARTRCREERET
jgi:hypothetical protein